MELMYKKIMGSRNIRFLLLFGVMYIFSLTQSACSDSAGSEQSSSAGITGKQPERKTSISPIVKDFVLLLTGNWAGQLEPCGCSEKQLGGIDRRSDKIKEIAPDYQSRVMIDAGPLIKKANRQGQLKFETFLYSLKQLKYDAISLTGDEILLLGKLSISPDKRPVLICSNMGEEERKKINALEFFQKTLILKKQKLDCLIFALNDPAEIKDKLLVEQLKLGDPYESLRKILAKMSINPDKPSKDRMVIVMLQATKGDLAEQIQKIAAIDILTIRGIGDEPELYRVSGKAAPLVCTTGKLGKYITRFNIGPGKVNNHSEYLFSTVEIDSQFAQDQAIVDIINDYQEMLKIENPVADESAIDRLALENNNRFVGNKSCGGGQGCHEDIYEKWKHFGHGHAMKTLIDKNREFDPECVICHSVGMEYESGYRSMEQTPELANVGCEMCHGPGESHIEDTSAQYQNQFADCQDCHDHETSPSFESKRAEYFQKIKHWK